MCHTGHISVETPVSPVGLTHMIKPPISTLHYLITSKTLVALFIIQNGAKVIQVADVDNIMDNVKDIDIVAVPSRIDV